jgi:hypothetical protein
MTRAGDVYPDLAGCVVIEFFDARSQFSMTDLCMMLAEVLAVELPAPTPHLVAEGFSIAFTWRDREFHAAYRNQLGCHVVTAKENLPELEAMRALL